MTEQLGRLITILDVIGLQAFVPEPPRGPGPPTRGSPRPGQMLRRQGSARHSNHQRLDRTPAGRQVAAQICGWERRAQVPRESTFRAFNEFAQGDLPGRMHAALVERTLEGRVVGVVARDATEIEAREKPVEKDGKDDPPPPAAEPPKRRGRPRKGEERPKPEPSRLERQATQSLAKMLAELPTACDVGCKKNSKGYKETWIGYKLHLDVACGQIPVACVLTSASVHDSQVAIPLMTMTSARIVYLYEAIGRSLRRRNHRPAQQGARPCAADRPQFSFAA